MSQLFFALGEIGHHHPELLRQFVFLMDFDWQGRHGARECGTCMASEMFATTLRHRWWQRRRPLVEVCERHAIGLEDAARRRLRRVA